MNLWTKDRFYVMSLSGHNQMTMIADMCTAIMSRPVGEMWGRSRLSTEKKYKSD